MKILFLTAFLLPFCSHAGALKWQATAEIVTPNAGEALVSAYFKFTNSSDSPVGIKAAKASCADCTEIVWDEKIYAPGESGEIIVTVKLAGLNGKSVKYITVEATDNQKFPDRLALTVLAPEKLLVPEKRLRWEKGDLTSRAMEISSAVPGAVIYIKEIKPEGVFTVSLDQPKAADASQRLSVTPAAPMNEPRRALIVVGLRSPDGSEYTETLTASRR